MSILDRLDRLAEPKNMRIIVAGFCVFLVVAVVLGAVAIAIAFQSVANAREAASKAAAATVSAKKTAAKANRAASDAKTAIRRVESGRKIGSAINCATTSAIIDAGRETIRSGAYVRPAEFALALENLGLPPFTTRAQYARAAARGYARKISIAVGKTGVRGVVREDGTLDCAALQKAAKIKTTP